MTLQRGRFIVLEGTDGSGTTTQTARLVQWLETFGIPALATREPSAGPVGQLLRCALEKRLTRPSGQSGTFDWLTLALLFAADRLDHLRQEILPALEAGTWVISDRYALSSLIYQSLTAPEPGPALKWVRELNAPALRPDLVLVLDVDVETAEERRRLRGGPEELFEYRALQAQLAQAYCVAEHYTPADAIIHIDGTRAPADVAEGIAAAIQARLMPA